jgi:hypothetical protein
MHPVGTEAQSKDKDFKTGKAGIPILGVIWTAGNLTSAVFTGRSHRGLHYPFVREGTV